MTELKRGMKPFTTEQIRLKFAAYADLSKIPPIPEKFGHVKVAQPNIAGGWGMLGNDQYGDCTIAGICHGLQVWNLATKKTIVRFSDRQVIQQYLQLTGGADDGLDPVQVASWWRKSGLVDSSGVAHKIRSYSAITNYTQAIQAAYLFGFSGLGLYLPDSADKQFSQGHIWDDLNGKPEGGHYVPLVGRNTHGHLMCITWGRLQGMTHEYFQKYFIGGVAYTSQDYMLATGLSPEGFNFAQLDADLSAIA